MKKFKIIFFVLFSSLTASAEIYDLPINYDKKINNGQKSESRYYFGTFHRHFGNCVVMIQKKDKGWLVGFGDGHSLDLRKDEPKQFRFSEVYKGEAIYTNVKSETDVNGIEYSSFVKVNNGKFVSVHWAYKKDQEKPNAKWSLPHSKYCKKN